MKRKEIIKLLSKFEIREIGHGQLVLDYFNHLEIVEYNNLFSVRLFTDNKLITFNEFDSLGKAYIYASEYKRDYKLITVEV